MAEAEARRIYPDEKGQLILPPELCYGQDKDEVWRFRHHLTHGGSLVNHEVEEHEDGTITVRPSILMTGPRSDNHMEMVTIHGFLTRGVWRDC